ncbi:uncharacterized protein LOC131313441 isoform X2 [Rhododendron vialii]|uniref:uncharacterized protein LOC131313441 isoform X2 n=1 Tax=Rhododendron vialii TaxID=182163 RepID=UPI00265DE48A|nr:uncharacterized protein LOC131313441 isoform X2 [Rhododendron vialii]
MESKHHHHHSPTPLLLKDISNFKTPKHPPPSSRNPNNNLRSPYTPFFTASKQTPSVSSSSRPRPHPSSSRSKISRRLKAFELEQSKSSRKAQIDKEKSLKSLAKSLTVWLNFLLQNPGSCGCDVSRVTGENGSAKELEARAGLGHGKRESCSGAGVVGVDTAWRCPKRMRGSAWCGGGSKEDGSISNSKFSALQSSLQDVCSFDDLHQRMKLYLSLGSCKEIFSVMTHVTKNIDEGRLKMKAHCPIVTDVGMKEKASRILMCYNPVWLRIGLYIIFGGDSLLPTGDVNSEKEIAFLKMVIEKQFFSHGGLARVYAYNKLVEGLYRPGYFEVLGNVILKRFLLLALILDRAKTQSCLPIEYGIDALDGGSPLLFTLQSKSKSSGQLICDFLSSEVMHGEGNLLAHLVIVGYKVSHHQSPLNEFDFSVTELFVDLRDGVRLCRAIQLLQHDTSILTKILVPSDSHKKNVANCGIAMQHLKQAGVPLFDEDGSVIVGEDIVSGDKELTLSLLWNIFIHLQLPLLINKTLLLEEISRIRGGNAESSINSTLLDMLLNWIQAICESYDFRVDGFASLVDGKAMWCLLDYYFRKELDCSCSPTDVGETSGETSIMSLSDYTDAVHNFILSQKLATLLGNFPEVLQVSDILEHKGACNSQSVVILLVFLSFQLIIRKNTDQLNFHKLLGFSCQSPERRRLSMERCFVNSEAVLNQEDRHGNTTEDGIKSFKAIMAWWQDMAMQSKRFDKQPGTCLQFISTSMSSSKVERENAAKVIQSHFRRSMKLKDYMQTRSAVSFLQNVIRAWLAAKRQLITTRFCTRLQDSSYRWKQSEVLDRYITYIVDRHNFVKLKKAVEIIQHATRAWISRKHHCRSNLAPDMSTFDVVNAAVVVQKCIRGWRGRSIYFQRVTLFENELQTKAASTIQLSWKKFLVYRSLCCQHLAATKIQSCYRGWLTRKSFVSQKEAVLKIQSVFQCARDIRRYKIATRSAIVIQSYVRGWIARRGVRRLTFLIVVLQSHCRGWFSRREILAKREAVIKIQSACRCIQCWKVFRCHRNAAIEIQRFVRGQIVRRRLLGASCLYKGVPMECPSTSRTWFHSLEWGIFLCSVLKLQRWWRGVLLQKSRTKSAVVIQSHVRGWIARREENRKRQCIIIIQTRGVLMEKSRMKSAVVIQSHVRGWIARREAKRKRHCITTIQSYWKGYLARKDSRGKQLIDLRLRVKKTAANVDDGMRIINRLVAALSDLLSMKSVSGILHTCATLDMATKYSQKCCEKLVEAGAIDTLLKLIRSVSRSIPDQEVLKHALSTLRNLARYSHLAEVLVGSRGSLETVLCEFLRNKEEAYFIASELLKKICSSPKGVEAVRNSPALLKRLHNLVEDLRRKAGNEKRNARGVLAKELVERRLSEAVELLNLITNG